MMERTKCWWLSKTIWVNLIALVGAIVVAAGLDAARWEEIGAVILAAVNIGLRLVTKDEIQAHQA